jgi:hypothetical protein
VAFLASSISDLKRQIFSSLCVPVTRSLWQINSSRGATVSVFANAGRSTTSITLSSPVALLSLSALAVILVAVPGAALELDSIVSGADAAQPATPINIAIEMISRIILPPYFYWHLTIGLTHIPTEKVLEK